MAPMPVRGLRHSGVARSTLAKKTAPKRQNRFASTSSHHLTATSEPKNRAHRLSNNLSRLQKLSQGYALAGSRPFLR